MSNLRGLYKREIRSMDDFENQDADFVYLETLSDYDIRTTLITGKQFVIPDGGVVEFVGFDPFISGVVYTGTDSAFIGGDFLGFTFDHMFISTPLGNVHNIDKVSSTGSQVFIEDTVYVDCAGVGTARNIAQYSGYFNSFQDIGQGFNLESVRLINIGQSTVNSWKNEVSTMFTFDGDIDSIQLNGIEYIPNTNETIFDFKVGANIASANITSNVYNQTLGGELFAAGSRTQTDEFLNFDANSGMPKSIVFGNMSIPTDETVTIASSGTPVIVNDANTGGVNIWNEIGNTSRFTFDNTLGRFTYTGLETTDVSIISSSSIEKVGGGQDFIATLIAKNGTVISESKSGSQNTNPTNVVSIADIELSTGDYIEMAVQNDTGTSNIVVNISNFIIKD